MVATKQKVLVKASRWRVGWWHCKQVDIEDVQIGMEFTLRNCTASSSVYTRSALTLERRQV
jgi:hypothetical protein